ncbi:Caspase b [Dissostichus eleginoides]|uniref:Caspase b n=1 Tax=Dissostichus eleginoides TaxID=100907 RepID=A0AAD9FC61_DISEL|nr:Caspase b [Dissostichus eleginoides]
METLKQILFSTLEDLGKEDFKKFKWYLQQKYLGFKGIPKSRLEDADRMDTVDQMFLNYCVNTFKVTLIVLGEIQQNELKEELSKHPSEPAGLRVSPQCLWFLCRSESPPQCLWFLCRSESPPQCLWFLCRSESLSSVSLVPLQV